MYWSNQYCVVKTKHLAQEKKHRELLVGFKLKSNITIATRRSSLFDTDDSKIESIKTYKEKMNTFVLSRFMLTMSCCINSTWRCLTLKKMFILFSKIVILILTLDYKVVCILLIVSLLSKFESVLCIDIDKYDVCVEILVCRISSLWIRSKLWLSLSSIYILITNSTGCYYVYYN